MRMHSGVLYCTALFCTVLYKKRRMKEGKIRKFAYKKRTDRQTDGSKTETTLSSVDTRGSWPILKSFLLKNKSIIFIKLHFSKTDDGLFKKTNSSGADLP